MSSASAYQRAVAAIRMRGDTLPAVATARAFREAAAAASPPNPSLERFAAQLEALVMQARGDEAGYVASLQAQLPANRVPRRRSMTPQTTLVISEELGAALLQAGRAAEAVAAYEQALEDRPNRAAALLGLARARAAAGDAAGAREAYARLATVWARADADLPDVGEVRRAQPAPVGN